MINRFGEMISDLSGSKELHMMSLLYIFTLFIFMIRNNIFEKSSLFDMFVMTQLSLVSGLSIKDDPGFQLKMSWHLSIKKDHYSYKINFTRYIGSFIYT
jgi:hypothetical protein